MISFVIHNYKLDETILDFIEWPKPYVKLEVPHNMATYLSKVS